MLLTSGIWVKVGVMAARLACVLQSALWPHSLLLAMQQERDPRQAVGTSY